MSTGRAPRAYTDDPDCWQNLANAVITQAAYDYRAAARKLRRNPEDHTNQWQKTEIKKFFRSRWFSVLTEADGEYILRRLEEEAASGERVKYERKKKAKNEENTEDNP